MLELASLPKRRRLQETLEYEEQTAEALAVERRDMSYRLEKLEHGTAANRDAERR